jgi:hypothetical protein
MIQRCVNGLRWQSPLLGIELLALRAASLLGPVFHFFFVAPTDVRRKPGIPCLAILTPSALSEFRFFVPLPLGNIDVKDWLFETIAVKRTLHPGSDRFLHEEREESPKIPLGIQSSFNPVHNTLAAFFRSLG